ncbi:MAG: type II toxin-antitoxin system VapC family toxin [Gallionellaceae bacterium]
MILYLDTSAGVKLYVREPGSKELRAYTAKAETMAASVVAYPEARAAFARLKAQGISTEEKHQHTRAVATAARSTSRLKPSLSPMGCAATARSVPGGEP